SLAVTNVSAQGNLTLSATANAFTSDPIQSNNCATATAFFSSPSPSPTPTPSPTPNPTPIHDLQLLLDQAGPLPFQAAALDSLLLMRDPFPIVNDNDLLNFGTDRNTRVILFVRNLPTTNLDSACVVVSLTDNRNQVFDLPAEDVRYLSDFGFTQVTFRLPDSAAAGTCTLSIKLG